MRTDLPRTFVVTGARSSGVAAARRFVRDSLEGHVPPEVISDMTLVASELVSNAVRHGSKVPLEITVETDGSVASVTIEHEQDHLADIPPVADWTIVEPDRPTGRGLGIVRALCDGITIAQHGDTLSITATRRSAGAGVETDDPSASTRVVSGTFGSIIGEQDRSIPIDRVHDAIEEPSVIEVRKRGHYWVSETGNKTIARASTKRQVLRDTMARIRNSNQLFTIRIRTANGRLLREHMVPLASPPRSG